MVPNSVRKRKNTFLITQLLYDAPFPGNPREYPHKPYIVRILKSLGYIVVADSIVYTHQFFVVGSERRTCF